MTTARLTVRLNEDWLLTNDHSSSSYGRLVMLHEPTGTAYGPGDILPGTGGTQAREHAASLADGMGEGEQDMLASFSQGWPW